MQIFLLRHGAAAANSSGSDRDRELTAQGQGQVKAVVGAAAEQLAAAAIVSSPYRRAIQSARIAGGLLGKDDIATSEALTPDSRPEQAWDEIRAYRSSASALLLVGHEPLFSSLTAYLLGFPDLSVEFNTASLACIAVDAGALRPRGVLRWLINPAVARSQAVTSS